MDQVEDGTPRYEAIVEELDYTDEENKHKPCQSMQKSLGHCDKKDESCIEKKGKRSWPKVQKTFPIAL